MGLGSWSPKLSKKHFWRSYTWTMQAQVGPYRKPAKFTSGGPCQKTLSQYVAHVKHVLGSRRPPSSPSPHRGQHRWSPAWRWPETSQKPKETTRRTTRPSSPPRREGHFVEAQFQVNHNQDKQNSKLILRNLRYAKSKKDNVTINLLPRIPPQLGAAGKGRGNRVPSCGGPRPDGSDRRRTDPTDRSQLRHRSPVTRI